MENLRMAMMKMDRRRQNASPNSHSKKWNSRIMNQQTAQSTFKLLDRFLASRKLLGYGGTAINNILPKEVQFYNLDAEIADYDFFSPNALQDAKDLADLLYAKGCTNVVAKAGVHAGTFKVFVDFISVADITQLPTPLYQKLLKDCITVDGLRYCPPNFLRMNIHSELCKPKGDISRWQKIYKRFLLLNRHFPFIGGPPPPPPLAATKRNHGKSDTQQQQQQRVLASLFPVIEKAFVDAGVVFFGNFAFAQYGALDSRAPRKGATGAAAGGVLPFFDVLAERVDETARDVLSAMQQAVGGVGSDGDGGGNAQIELVSSYWTEETADFVPYHVAVQVRINGGAALVIANLYKTNHCFNYNPLRSSSSGSSGAPVSILKIATLDTMMYFYLLFYYLDDAARYDKTRLLGMAGVLMNLCGMDRSETGRRGRVLLRRFSDTCYGSEKSLVELKVEKGHLHNKLRKDRTSLLYQKHFLKYQPGPEQQQSEASK